MNHRLESIEYAMIYLIALAIAVAIITVPKPALSGAPDPYLPPHAGGYVGGGELTPRRPRWSNQHHYDAARAGRLTDCLAGPDYQPGIDAWGDPVIPADLPRRYREGPPYGVRGEVHVGQKNIAGKRVDLYADDIYYDFANRELSSGGRPWVKDCVPPTK